MESPSQQTPTSTGTPASWRVSAISAGATVVTQPSAETPLEVELSVTNNHDIAVRLVPTDRDTMLTYMPPFEGSSVNLRMVPATFDYSVIPDSRSEGCWRFDAESPAETNAKLRYTPEALPMMLEPNETYTIRHEVYHNGSSDACFPDSEYQAIKPLFFSEKLEHDVYRYEDQLAFDIRYRLSVSDDGIASISVDGLKRKNS